ncbi:MAG: RICIN domain-containing protein [Actinobacteria bacterium]|nr:RICIN domain-containing protein [Actinomycetota bacterium]
MNKLFKQRGGRGARLLIGAILFVIPVVIGVATPASAASHFIPHPARLSVNSSGRCLTVNTISRNIWDKIYTSNCVLGWEPQLWDIDPDGTGYYTIRSRSNGQYLDVYSYRQEDGATVVTWPYIRGATNQHWSLENNNYGSYNLRAQHSGKCLNAYSSQPWVVQWHCAGYSNQAWSAGR